MPNQLLNLPAYLSNDATFRQWGLGIASSLSVAGLVKTNAPGQIDWASANAPNFNSFAGYEIWRFDDDLQSTLPIFVKVEYGAGSNADRPAVAITAGTSIDGGGGISGQKSNRFVLSASGSRSPGDKLNSYVCGNETGVIACLNLSPDSTSYYMTFAIGRALDGSGAPTADGFFIYTAAGSLRNWTAVPTAGSVPNPASYLPVPSTRGGLSTVGVNVALGVPAILLGKVRYTDILLSYEHSDIGELTPFSANNLGASHTYMPLGDGGGVGHADGNNIVTAMLWE